MTAPDSRPAGAARRIAFTCAVAAAALCGSAWGQELPASAACRNALQALERAEAAMADTGRATAASAVSSDVARLRAAAARLQPLRQQVGQACLGGLTTSPPPSQHTWVVPRPIQPLSPLPRVPVPPPPQPPVPPPPGLPPPVTVGACNAGSCVASDGSTLTRVGPNLIGPRGVCTLQGVVLHCP